jgi:hypothetical protein
MPVSAVTRPTEPNPQHDLHVPTAPAERSARRPGRRRVGLFAVAMLLAVLAAPAFAQFGKNKITYREFDWKIYHSPHFDVYYYTDEEHLLEKVVSFAESAYDRLSREFDHQIQEPTPLIFYETHSAFEQNNIIVNFIPEGVGAFASPARNRMVMPVDLPDPQLMGLMLHELTHIFQYEILFQGSYGRSVTSAPPQWFMEGMASYMAKDEESHDRMVVRDAVVNDLIPAITQRGISGYAAYRFGHAAFDFIEERWGKEGFLDFIYEFRNTLGGNVGRAVERTFRMDPEDFDVEFRRWLRKQYLPQLIQTGEPSDFGRLFRTEEGLDSEETSPVASPSGDLVASISTYRNQVDVALFDARKRRVIGNLTRGFSNDYQYLTAQFLTTARRSGRDLTFSPDGNQIALFAKRERGRALLLVDVLEARLDRVVEMEVEQQLAPAWSPDGRMIAFAGARNGRFDIFALDLETSEVLNLTDDDLYDAAPVYSPDGKSLVYSAVVDQGTSLFRIDLATGQRYRLTEGAHNDVDAVFSTDGSRLFFASDRSGADNIYSLELATGKLVQWTDAVTGCYMPTILRDKDQDRLVFAGYWRGSQSLYLNDLDKPVREIDPGTGSDRPPTDIEELARYQPDIEVTIDDANKEDYGRGKFFLEDGGAQIGVADDQTFLADTYLAFSDYLGDKRIYAQFSSIESFANFDVAYIDLSNRLQWSVRLFDDRTYYIGVDQRDGLIRRGRAAYKQTGAIGSISYPFSFYTRAEAGLGYIFREIDFQSVVIDPNTGQPIAVVTPREDDFPIVTAALVGDTTVFSFTGPVSGRRWRLDASYAPNLDDSGTLATTLSLDVRQYVPLSRRTSLAFRLFGGMADGDFPAPFYFGGLDTVRGFDFRELVGDRAFFANAELRFPLVDVLATPVLAFRGIRGRIFLDVGGAYFNDVGSFRFWDSEENRLQDGISAYGWGITVDFGGLDLNWDFAQQWDFKESCGRGEFGGACLPENDDGFRTSFWIGGRF